MRIPVADGEVFRLLPGGAALWERTATLLVADLHVGKDATFRAAGLPLPAETGDGNASEQLRKPASGVFGCQLITSSLQVAQGPVCLAAPASRWIEQQVAKPQGQ